MILSDKGAKTSTISFKGRMFYPNFERVVCWRTGFACLSNLMMTMLSQPDRGGSCWSDNEDWNPWIVGSSGSGTSSRRGAFVA